MSNSDMMAILTAFAAYLIFDDYNRCSLYEEDQ